MRVVRWTDAENDIILANHAAGPADKLAVMLPGRTVVAIRLQTWRLGLRPTRKRKCKPAPSSPAFPTDYKPSTIPAESIAAKAESLKAKYGTYNTGVTRHES